MQKKISILLATMAITAAFVVMAPAILTKAAYAQEEFNVDVRIDSASINLKTREVTVFFTVICSNIPDGDAFGATEVAVSQKEAAGIELIFYECSVGENPLSVTVEADTGLFKPGKALVSIIELTACTRGLDGGIICIDSVSASKELIVRPAHP
jgi:hypothetical protein